ncbi:MAG: hypothetical protein GPOALKHO_000799 [Sodalis sp.]|nr:MAG: hypothetical protein GPOALKHO_000799 [Sodalis sp.]
MVGYLLALFVYPDPLAAYLDALAAGDGHTTLFTCATLLVQIFLIYCGPGQFTSLRDIPLLWSLLPQHWLCAKMALALNSAAYNTQLFPMRAIPDSQRQSCAVLDMSGFQSLRLLMPFVIKQALPSYSNEVVLVFKSTSLALYHHPDKHDGVESTALWPNL